MYNFDDEPALLWDDWYLELQELAAKHGVSVADQDAWRPEWEQDKTPADALYAEYPEYGPQTSCATQHTTPCRECPFRRTSAPGWLGASQPGEFLALADSDNRAPCHMAGIDYEASDWKQQAATAPQCAGRAIFMANRAKLPAAGLLTAKADRELVFTRPHEFVAHHAGLDPKTLETTLIWDLYAIKR